MNFCDMIKEIFSKYRSVHFKIDPMVNGDPGIFIRQGRTEYKFYLQKNGDVLILPSGWVPIGNIHEPDILKRIEKAAYYIYIKD